MLLAKFPAFDSRWDTDKQLAWFDAFLRLFDALEAHNP
jgi:hypothetical protein